MLSDRDYMYASRYRRQESVIKPLIIANVVVFVLTGFGMSQANSVSGWLALHPIGIRQFHIWTLFSYMFVHGGFGHILFNMWGLYLFGSFVEPRLGPNRFLRLYFVSGLVGGVAWLLANWWGTVVVQIPFSTSTDAIAGLRQAGIEVARQGDMLLAAGSPSELLGSGVPILRTFGGVVGASGAVFGVMLAAAMTAPEQRIMLMFPPIPMRLKTFVAGYAAIEIAMAWADAGRHTSRIAHLAHLGGLFGAFLYMRKLGAPNPLAGLVDRIRDRFADRSRIRTPGAGPVPRDFPGDLSVETDRILDKIGREGIASLTPEERRILEMARDKLRERSGR